MTTLPIVLLTHAIEPAMLAPLDGRVQVRIASAHDAQTLLQEGRDAAFILVRAPLPAALFEQAPRLRGVVRQGAGLDMIPVPHASRAGVAVCNVPGVNARSVAEHAMGQMIALARFLPRMHAAMGQAGWDAARRMADDSTELAGKTVVIVGMGAIGQCLARICRAGFGMDVLGVRRRPADADDHASYCTLDEALPRADYLVLACPLTDETRGLIDGRRLALLKPGARVVNVARGAVVDDAALLAALRTGHVAGAALDVFAKSPLPSGSAFHDVPNLLLTPHVAGITKESMRGLAGQAVEQVVEMLQGRLPRHLANPEAREAILARWAGLGRT